MLTTVLNSGSRAPIYAAAARSCPDRHAGGEYRTFAAGEELFSEGEPAHFFYKVVHGTVRSSKLLSDARRQIDSFHFEGDIFGFESTEEFGFSAEAVEDTTVIAYRRSSFHNLTRHDPSLAEQVMAATVASLRRAREHMLLLGRRTPQEKIALFLLDIARRLQKGDRFDLPMRRADIADYLGLTKETVSRTLTHMNRLGLIKLEAIGRTILLSDKAALRRLNA
jgi:CRP/FNR family transcriptional regulator, nitrogen fixation regulation protein